MDVLNKKLSEISARLDQLENLTLQIQRENNLKHEELKQYITSSFNFIHSSISNGLQPGLAQQRHGQNGSSGSFELLEPGATSPYLGSLPSQQQNDQQQQQQQQQPTSSSTSQMMQYADSGQQQLPRNNFAFNNRMTSQQQQSESQGGGQYRDQGLTQQEEHHHIREAGRQASAPVPPPPTLPPPLQRPPSQQRIPQPSQEKDELSALPQVPLITIKRSLATVEEIWKEYYYGIDGNPSIRALDARYGRLWRDKQKERTYFRRKKIFNFVERYMDFYNCDDSLAIEYLEEYRKDQSTGKKKTLMWLYTHMPVIPNEK